MGKRQIRIFPKSFSQQLPSLANQEANILFKNGTVLHGIINQITGSAVHLTDMIRRKHAIDIHHIAEIIVDKETLY